MLGHKEGVEAIKRVVRRASELNIGPVKQMMESMGITADDIDEASEQLEAMMGSLSSDLNDDEDSVDAFFMLSRLEGIIPAIESAHAVAYAIKLAKKMKKGSILVNLSGRGDKDMDFILEKYGIRDVK